MKFTDKPYEDTFHIYTSGYGRDCSVCLRFNCVYEENFHYDLHIDDAERLSEYLINAICTAKIREKSKKEIEEID